VKPDDGFFLLCVEERVVVDDVVKLGWNKVNRKNSGNTSFPSPSSES